MIHIIDNPAGLRDLQRFLNDMDVVAVDCETTGLSHINDRIVGISIADSYTSYYLVAHEYVNGELVERLSGADLAPILNKLSRLNLVMHNASFDIRHFRTSYGIDFAPNLKADTMLMAHTLDENKFQYGLKALAKDVFGDSAIEEQTELLAYLKSIDAPKGEMYKAPAAILGKYAAKDALLTYQLYDHYQQQLIDQNLIDFFYIDEVMPLLKHVTIDMEFKGIPIDVDYMRATLTDINKVMDDLEAQIIDAVTPSLGDFYDWWMNKEYTPKRSGPFLQAWLKLRNVDLPRTKGGSYSLTAKIVDAMPDCLERDVINQTDYMPDSEIPIVQDLMWAADGRPKRFKISSKDHLKRLFFTKLKETALSFTDKGNPQVDDEFLDVMAQKYSWASKLQTWNGLSKIRGTYLEQYLESQVNGIYYPSYHQHRTTSGRYSGTAQQLPRIKSSEEEPDEIVRSFTNRIRNFFISAPGWSLVDADYASLEVVVFADDAGDDALLDIIRNDFDFYSQIVIKVMGVTEFSADKKAPNFLKKHKPELRQSAKPYSLGIRYGYSAYKLHKDLGISQPEANSIVQSYFTEFPKLKWRMDEIITNAKLTGTVKSKAGRVRRIPELKQLNDQYGSMLFDSLELWSEYKDTPATYETMKAKARLAKNLVNNALNFPIQSLAASIVSQASIAINREFSERNMVARIALSVHDELCIHCPNSEVDAVKEIMQRRMENTIKLAVPLSAEPIVGTRYGDVK